MSASIARLQINIMKNFDDEVRKILEEAPNARKALMENYDNLLKVSEYCHDNYLQSGDNSRKALEETKNFTNQSLASIAYQITTLASSVLSLFDAQTNQLCHMESSINLIGQTVEMHKEKVSRREIGVFTAVRRVPRSHKILPPIKPPAGVQPCPLYSRQPINYQQLDGLGHGVKVCGKQSDRTGMIRKHGASIRFCLILFLLKRIFVSATWTHVCVCVCVCVWLVGSLRTVGCPGGLSADTEENLRIKKKNLTKLQLQLQKLQFQLQQLQLQQTIDDLLKLKLLKPLQHPPTWLVKSLKPIPLEHSRPFLNIHTSIRTCAGSALFTKSDAWFSGSLHEGCLVLCMKVLWFVKVLTWKVLWFLSWGKFLMEEGSMVPSEGSRRKVLWFSKVKLPYGSQKVLGVKVLRFSVRSFSE
uniref:uncharacterized protein LOC122785305 n=1 Tax=Solea senegalensis TaxID=28829 RepID=UPI001CD837EE|nr:uncharacterized protein LOC122785305 [Solea senegalensis]